MFRRAFLVCLLVVAVGPIASAADLNKAITDAVGRVRAAENGARDIKAKSSEEGNRVQALYTAAASANNDWLDLVIRAVERGDTAAPDVAAVAQRAASALIEWVGGRNHALGIPVLTAASAENARTMVEQNLADIAAEFWKSHRRANDRRRASAITDLNDRLRWKTWEAVQ